MHHGSAGLDMFGYLLDRGTADHQVGIASRVGDRFRYAIHGANFQRGQWWMTRSTYSDNFMDEMAMSQSQTNGTT
jgi:hypothetical protein